MARQELLISIQAFGQSVWLDSLSRGMLRSRELQKLLEEDGLRGVTSAPAIFDRAVTGSVDYDEAIRALALEGRGTNGTYEALVVEDVADAADLLHPASDRSDEH